MIYFLSKYPREQQVNSPVHPLAIPEGTIMIFASEIFYHLILAYIPTWTISQYEVSRDESA